MQKREEILRGAEHVFRRKSYVATTTEEIAAMTGHSVGTIYNLFKSKEGLFAEVVLSIARDLIRHVERLNTSPNESTDVLLERQIDLRVENQERYGLFFRLFVPSGPGSNPTFEQLPKEVHECYLLYMELMEAFFAKVRPEVESLSPVGLALCFDGLVQMWIGYREHATPQMSRAQISRFVKHFFLEALRKPVGGENSGTGPAEPRRVFITHYDRIRLLDLISAFRSLRNRRMEKHLLALEQELKRAKVVQPNEIPADTITMNSRVKIRNLRTQEELVYTLSFPVDAVDPDRLSILDPVGTAMLGHRIGDVVEVPLPRQARQYLVEDLLYQPEAAKDFHL